MLHINKDNPIPSSEKRNVRENSAAIPAALAQVIAESIAWDKINTRKSESGKLYQTTQSQQLTWESPEGERFSITIAVNGYPKGSSDGKLTQAQTQVLRDLAAGKTVDMDAAKAILATLEGKLQ